MARQETAGPCKVNLDALTLGHIYSRGRGLGETGEAYVWHLKGRIREHFGEHGWKTKKCAEREKTLRKTRRKRLHFPRAFVMIITCDILIPCSRY